MKNTAYLILSALLAACACSKHDGPAGEGLKKWTFSADPSVKATIANNGSFAWSKGDEIKIWNSQSSDYVVFTDRVGKGVFTASAPQNSVFESAVYPASVAATTSSISLPAAYTTSEAAAGKAFPMWAAVSEGTNALSFSHLGAILRFTVKGVCAGMTKIRVSSTDGSISGTFLLSGSPLQIALQPGGTGDVTVNLGTVSETTDFLVSIPLPVGSYNYKIEVGSDSEPIVYTAYTNSAQTFERKKIYKLGELSFFRGNVLLESALEGDDYTVEQDNPYSWE